MIRKMLALVSRLNSKAIVTAGCGPPKISRRGWKPFTQSAARNLLVDRRVKWGKIMKVKRLLRPLLLAGAAAALSTAALAEEPVKIGVLTPLSGTYAPIGQQVRWGLELAAKEVNQKGGILGRQIHLLFEDSEANPAIATQKAEKLFQVEQVDFLTGTVNSGATLAVGQVAERNN